MDLSCYATARVPASNRQPRESNAVASPSAFAHRNDFQSLLEEARAEVGTVLFNDAATLLALSRVSGSAFNPLHGWLASDLFEYLVLPLVRVPQLVVVCNDGFGCPTYTLPLSAVSPDAWVRLQDMESTSATVIVRERELLLTGGDDSCSLLSLQTGQWRGGPKLPAMEERWSHCAGQIGLLSVVCGGLRRCNVVPTTFVLPACVGAAWRRGADMIAPRAMAGGVVVRAGDRNSHQLLVAGGLGGSYLSTFLDTCDVYDVVADRWVQLEARLCQPMTCRAAPIAGCCVVTVESTSRKASTECHLLDVRACGSQWHQVASPIAARSSHAMAAVDEHTIVLIGGADSDRARTDTMQLYDSRADVWSVREEWRLPVRVTDHCSSLFSW